MESESALLESPLSLENNHIIAQVGESILRDQLGQQTSLCSYSTHFQHSVLESLNVADGGTEEVIQLLLVALGVHAH